MSRFRRAAFTLVELLVVIGIIALLISVLLPALAKSRESANQVKCLSNMRQIALAIIQYANDNKGTMPAHGGFAVAAFSTSDPSSTWDWVAWHRRKDPVNGRTLNNTGVEDQNITHSAIARYMGIKPAQHTTPDEANNVNTTADSMFRCPSDPIDARVEPKQNQLDNGWYRYSYSANTFSMSKPGSPKKITAIRPASERLLLVCEDEKTIDDGVFNPNPNEFVNPDPTRIINAIASRHRLKRNETQAGTKDSTFGNVAFADGHGEFMSRKDASRQRYTGNPAPDPDGY